MKRFRVLVGLAALALAVSGIVVLVQGQPNPRSAFPAKATSPKPVWLKGEVVHADANSITVRHLDNALALETFTYAPGLRDKMRKLFDSGGYQYGDKVSVLHRAGETVALKIHGKPSKPR